MNDEFFDDELNETIDLSIYDDDKPSHKSPKFPFPIIGVIIAVIVAIIITVCITVTIENERRKPNNSYVDLYSYYGLEEGSLSLMYEGELLNNIIQLDDKYYFEFSFVYDNICNNFYYDESLDALLYTNATEIYCFPFASYDYDINGETKKSDYYVTVREQDTIYIALDFIKDKGPFSYMTVTDPHILVMINDDTTITPLNFYEDAVIRVDTSIKKEILATPGTDLWYEVVSDCKDGWKAVATIDGRRGYVENKYIQSTGEAYTYTSGYKAEEYANLLKDYEVHLVWHGVYWTGNNKNISSLLKTTKGVTTVSPTWFKVENETGSLLSLADKNYVNYVHGLGMEVWPLVSDFTSTDGDGWSHKELFGNATNRRNLIDNLIKEIKALGCKGLNIDFERITTEVGDDYAQFMRELSVRCRKEGIILSVDVMVPTSYNMKYNYAVLGEFVDYVMIMGYDEYYSGGNEAGPNASLPFEKNGIENGLKYMPSEKILSGIPFYTRMWIESVDANGATVLESKTYYMQNALTAVDSFKLTKVWDDELQCYAASGTVNGSFYQIWLEEERSMTAKLQLIDDYNLGGYAAWSLGQEMPSIWNVLNR